LVDGWWAGQVRPNLLPNFSVYNRMVMIGGAVAAEVAALELVGPCPSDAAADALGGEAFANLYRSQFGPLSGYAAALTGDPVAAVDIAQEAFTRLLARWRKVRDARAWLFFVATNLSRDYWRGVVRDRELTERAGARHSVVTPASDPWLRDLVERLPARQRQAILLHYYADIAIDDIARLLHVPTGTVKRRLHDGRVSLAVDVRGGHT
jgi:RNA polymerase sigma-70 factor (ECF subfamily)